MSVLTWFIIADAALCIMVLAGDRWYRRSRKRRSAPVTDPFRVVVLAHACGPCTGIQGTRTCICPGNCGHRKCKGRPVSTDLASALQRITREGGGRG